MKPINPTEEAAPFLITINASQQSLRLSQGNHTLLETGIATAINGLGEQKNSEKTPRGWHQIRAKIGANQTINTVFVGRRATGEVFNEALAQHYPQRDWILSRILWLSGLEKGKNRLGNVDTMQRYIYIHGCPDSVTLAVPSSHGCIRMRNHDIIRLFDLTPLHTRVYID